MAPGSPRVTRARAKTRRHNDSDDDSHHRHDRSGSKHSESDSESEEYSHARSHSSLLSTSPNSSSSSPSCSRMYPDLSKELNESGDLNMSSRSYKDEGKGRSDVSPRQRVSKETTPRGQESSGKKIKPSKTIKIEVEESTNNNILLFVGMILVIVAALVYMFMPGSTSTSGNVSNASESGYELFEKDVKVLQSSFPSQTNRFWNTVSASARHVYYQQDPCYPSVILMASHNKNQRLNTCLAKKIAYTFSVSRGVTSGDSDVGTDIEDIKHLDPEQQKLELDDVMKLSFQKRREKAFVISNVQHLAPKAALLLHGFCDGDNAPYKDVMILLSFQVDDSVVFKSVKDVEDYLVKIWSKGLDMDKLSAIMSRIANNPVIVQPETESVVSEICTGN